MHATLRRTTRSSCEVLLLLPMNLATWSKRILNDSHVPQKSTECTEARSCLSLALGFGFLQIWLLDKHRTRKTSIKPLREPRRLLRLRVRLGGLRLRLLLGLLAENPIQAASCKLQVASCKLQADGRPTANALPAGRNLEQQVSVVFA